MNLPAGWLAATALVGQASMPRSRPSESETVRVGEPVGGTLGPGDSALPGHGPSKRLSFPSESPGPLTLTLESFDFDAFLRVEDEAGGTVAEDDNGGVETNARVVLDAKAGVRYRVLVGAAKEGAGEFALSVARGKVDRPRGAALLDAGIAYRARAAERALSRGDKKAAAAHRLEEGRKRLSRSQFDGARVANEASLALSREVGDRAGEAKALGGLGNVDFALGDCTSARRRQEECLALWRELGDRAGEASALGNLGNVDHRVGDYSKAREHHERSVALYREAGSRTGEARSLGNLANALRSLGENTRAQEVLERSLALCRDLGDRAGEASALVSLGNVFYFIADYPKALEHHEESLSLFRQLGDRSGEVKALGNLGIVLRSIGDYPRARGHLE